MPVLRTVVTGIDGSEASLAAARWVHGRLPEDGQCVCACIGEADFSLPEGFDAELVRRKGPEPAAALLELAADWDADAIVVGPHGSGLGIGLGSVVRTLLAKAEVPVIVVDDSSDRPAASRAPIVACVGYGEPASAAVEWAATLADQRSCPLVLLHAVAYRPIFPLDSASDVLASYLGSSVSIEWASDEPHELAEQIAEDHPRLEISTHVDARSVIKAVSQAGEAADLVVLGKRSSDDFMQPIGTPRLRRLVARSRFPVAVIPAGYRTG